MRGSKGSNASARFEPSIVYFLARVKAVPEKLVDFEGVPNPPPPLLFIPPKPPLDAPNPPEFPPAPDPNPPPFPNPPAVFAPLPKTELLLLEGTAPNAAAPNGEGVEEFENPLAPNTDELVLLEEPNLLD